MVRRKSLYFTPIIKRLHKQYGFISILIYGPQGSGKTTLAIKIMRDLYGSYDRALNHLFFDLQNFVSTLEYYFNNKQRALAVTLDDAALELHRQQYRQNITTLFEKIYNLARTVSTCFIFTTIHVDDILRGLRNKFMYRVSMQRINYKLALGKIYHFTITPQLQPIIRLVAHQYVRLDLPKTFWRDYEVKRRDAVAKLFHQFKAAVARKRSSGRKKASAPPLNEALSDWGLNLDLNDLSFVGGD